MYKEAPDREKIINTLFRLCTDPKFTWAAWQCSHSESPDIVGLVDMPQFQDTINQILALIELPKNKPPFDAFRWLTRWVDQYERIVGDGKAKDVLAWIYQQPMVPHLYHYIWTTWSQMGQS